MKLRAIEAKSGAEVSGGLMVARGFWARLRGLMLRPPLRPGQGMYISPCNCVHTCFMTRPLDLLFVSREGVVLKAMRGLKPWRVSPVVRRAAAVIELPEGTLDDLGLGEGSVIALESEAVRSASPPSPSGAPPPSRGGSPRGGPGRT